MYYDREVALSKRLNAFCVNDLGLPNKDYYRNLTVDSFLKLKSVLNGINNIFTLKGSIAFIKWLANHLGLNSDAHNLMLNKILSKKPNANGYDIEMTYPQKIIAEVKCNIPINNGTVYGSAQRNGIEKDIEALTKGKSKSKVNPAEFLKFMVFLDRPEIREATKHLISNMKEHKEKIVFVRQSTSIESKENVYILFVKFNA